MIKLKAPDIRLATGKPTTTNIFKNLTLDSICYIRIGFLMEMTQMVGC